MQFETILKHFKSIEGIDDVFLLDEAQRFKLFEIEIEAEKKAFMGMGKTYNSGIREVMKCPTVICCITNMGFDWGCESHMLMMKEDEIVGEEIYDVNKIKELEKRPDVKFLHKNFVVYTAKVNFPRDIVEKICYFEYPALATEKEIDGSIFECLACYPSTAGDVYLKTVLYEKKDERGTGTILYGIKECQ